MSLARSNDAHSGDGGVFTHLLARLKESAAGSQALLRQTFDEWLGNGQVARSSVRRAIAESVVGPSDADDAAEADDPPSATIDESMVVHQPAAVLYSFWRDVENWPTLWRQLEDVEARDFWHSCWTVTSPAGGCASWEIEIFEERDGQWLAWRTTSGDLAMSGRVLFDSLTPLRTAMHVMLDFAASPDHPDVTPASILGENFAENLAADIRSFKRAMETGGLLPAA